MKQPPLPISFFESPYAPSNPRKPISTVLASISLLPVLSPSFFIQEHLRPGSLVFQGYEVAFEDSRLLYSLFKGFRLLYTLLGAPYHCQLLFPLILHSSTKHPILGCYSGLKLSYLNRGVKSIVIPQGFLTVVAYPEATSSPM